MKKRKNKKKYSLEELITQSIIFLFFVFSILIGIVGYNRFATAFTKEYKASAFKTAQTAAALINVDNLDNYLETDGKSEEYILTKKRLDILTDKQHVSVIYIIKPDKDFKHYTNIFNSVNESSEYEPWDINSRKKTTNKSYENYYKLLYEKKIDKAAVIRTKNLNGAHPHLTMMIPLIDSNGEVKSILCVQRFMKELKHIKKTYLLGVSSITLLVVLFAIVVSIYYVRKHIIKPVTIITKEAKRFADENTKVKNELNINISKINEISSLAISIDKMEKDTIEYINNLTNVTKEKERINTELKLASLIQENSLPNEFPAYPERSEFDLFASMIPAKEVGGDFYDFNLIDDDHLALVIADVSGKGIPAALLMMVTKLLINEYTLSIKDPAQVLTIVNDRLCKNNKTNMFITVWLGILEISTGNIIASNAGHEDPAIYRSNKGFLIDKQKHGIPVGAMEGYKYKNYNIKLEVDDKLFIYTDGVPEATNDKDEMYGLDNMITDLNKHCKNNPKKILENLKKDVDIFINGAVQFDDLTMLCLEYKCNRGEKMKKRFTADVKELDNVLNFINENISSHFNKKEIIKLDIAIEEAFVNIAKYSKAKNNYVDIDINVETKKIVIVFVDEGIKFNPLKQEEPNTKLSSEERKIGGLGIHIIKKTMDKVSYKYNDGKNILILEKNIEEEL